MISGEDAAGAVPRWHSAVIGLFIAAVFCLCAWKSLGTRLTDDDLMNLNFAWMPAPGELGLALLTPFTPFYRPAGALVYRVVFDVFGVNYLPFRIVIAVLLLINIWLVYRLARRLSESTEVGTLAALLYTFHSHMDGIYRNTGTLYDVLCATLSLGTLLFYVSVRQQGRLLNARAWLLFLALFISALNAKEMAAVIPALLLVYELIWFSPRAFNARGIAVWLRRQASPALISAVLTLVAFRIRTTTPGTAFSGNTSYALTVTAHQFMSVWGQMLGDLFFRKEPGLTALQVLLVWAALLSIAAAMRSRHLWFFLAFAFLAPLPIVFIPWRGFFVMYLPYAGWVMFAATVIVEGRNRLYVRVWKRSPLPPNAFEPERFFTFTLAALAILWLARLPADPEAGHYYYDASKDYIHTMKNELARLDCPVPEGGSIIFLRDPFPAQSWGPLELARLVYRDRNLRVDRPTMMKSAPDLSGYDGVFDFAGKQLVLVRARNGAGKRLEWPRS